MLGGDPATANSRQAATSVRPPVHVTSDSLVVMLIVGCVAGWLAGLVMRGSGYGVIGDIIVGLLGALVGTYLLQVFKLSVHLGHPLVDKAFVAFVGAVVLVFVIGFFRPRTLGERVSGWFRRF
jgi:uncharacterized membrane protein YeaQ/YmgE (transglycosylase-associated protein family)